MFIPFFFFVISLVCGASAFEVPPLTDSVVDVPQMMVSTQREALASALRGIYQKGGPQVAVLIVPKISPLTIEEASYRVVKNWKLGTEKKDNGILLMVAVEEHRIRIEVGQGVEGDLTDAYSRRIIDDIMVPLFRKGDPTAGILYGVQEILRRMNPPYDLSEYLNQDISTTPEVPPNWHRLILILAIVLLLIWLNRHGGGGGRSRYYGTGGGFYGGGGWGGGFGGSSGGFSGGGGGFSGGGASGSW